MAESETGHGIKMDLAGWAFRDFTLEEFVQYLNHSHPTIIEIAKDFVDDSVSIKKLGHVLLPYLDQNPEVKLYYAGTTDLIGCADYQFKEYLEYLKIQVAQASFLHSTGFRFFAGHNNSQLNSSDIIDRIQQFSRTIHPQVPLVEIHGGWESDIHHLKLLLDEVNAKIVLDFQNMMECNLSYDQLRPLLNSDNLAYFHTRNYAAYIEHSKSLPEEELWFNDFPQIPILWEPKKSNKTNTIKLINADHTAI